MLDQDVKTNESKLRTGFIDFTAGSMGGGLQVYVSQPMDTVKVKQQTFPKLYKNMIDCFIKTYRQDGIYRGLYAGSIPAVIANVAENSVLFAAYGGCQKVVAYGMNIEDTKDLPVLGNAFAGFIAAFFSTFTLCPTELIKCKLQALREMQQQNPNNAATNKMPITPWKLTRHIMATEGIPGFFRGLTSTFMREMPGYFFFFGGYEGTREFLAKPGQPKEEIGALRTMLAGAVGGITLWCSIFPADVIKSRIQVNNLKRTMTSVGLEIIRKEGVSALYNGLLPSVLRTIPATATLFLVYEFTKKTLNEML